MSVDLKSRYLGLELKNPLMASASPLTGDLDVLKRLEDAGAAAVVLPSLFEEQIEHEEMALLQLEEAFANVHPEATIGYFPEMESYNIGPDQYLEHIAQARKALSIPVIASLNGSTPGGWTRYAKLMQDAGASALELNVYLVAANIDETSSDVEARYIDLVAGVSESVSLPLAVKVGPHFSSFAHMATRLVGAGAKGLVLFNRFLQPDIDLATLEVKPGILLSTPFELRLPLRWIAILKGRIEASLAATSGAHSADDVVKLLLVGADAVMMASALLKHGPEHLAEVLKGMTRWLEEKEYVSVEQMKGSLSQKHSPDPSAFERANYMKALISYTSERS